MQNGRGVGEHTGVWPMVLSRAPFVSEGSGGDLYLDDGGDVEAEVLAEVLDAGLGEATGAAGDEVFAGFRGFGLFGQVDLDGEFVADEFCVHGVFVPLGAPRGDCGRGGANRFDCSGLTRSYGRYGKYGSYRMVARTGESGVEVAEFAE